MLLRIIGVVLLSMGLSLSLAVSADKMADAGVGLCEKVKTCALLQIEQENFTPEMREMMQPMLNSMCESMRTQIAEVPTGHPLFVPALTCIESMSALSCAQLQDRREVKTDQCEAYRQQAEKDEKIF